MSGVAEGGRAAAAMMRPSLHRINAMKRGSKVQRQYPDRFSVWKIVRGDKVNQREILSM